MNQPEALHPNLALIAARYDEIVDAVARKQLSPADARARIAQLEARDDQGVRWNIDPDNGAFVRRNAFGEAEYDTPPQYGVKTPDPFDVNDKPRVLNPHLRLQNIQAVGMTTPPTSLAGATQHLPPRDGAPSNTLAAAALALPNRVKAIILGAVALVTVIGFAVTGGEDETPTEPDTPAVTAPADPSAPAKK